MINKIVWSLFYKTCLNFAFVHERISKRKMSWRKNLHVWKDQDAVKPCELQSTIRRQINSTKLNAAWAIFTCCYVMNLWGIGGVRTKKRTHETHSNFPHTKAEVTYTNYCSILWCHFHVSSSFTFCLTQQKPNSFVVDLSLSKIKTKKLYIFFHV